MMQQQANPEGREGLLFVDTLFKSENNYPLLLNFLDILDERIKEHIEHPFDQYGFGGRGSVPGHRPWKRDLFIELLHNCWYRAYTYDYTINAKRTGPVHIRTFFGSEGVVIQIEDFGIGFNAKEALDALCSGGQHFFNNRGTGLKSLFLDPDYVVGIVSSRKPPTGTTISIMYKYRHLDDE